MKCVHCEDTGFESVDDEAGRGFARPCRCRRIASAGGDGLDVHAACRIPPRYEHCSLANFEPGHPSLTAALEKTMAWCNGYPYLGEDEGLGLLISGDNGVGKTHLAVSALREVVSKGARAQFWDFHELIREIKNSYNPETRTTELQVLEPVVQTDVLVLDDLGAWKMTDWMIDTLFYILNGRYMARRATIITTNFQDADLSQIKDADHLRRKEFLVERIGQRLRSRLMEMCLVVRIDGAPDRRQESQHGKRVAVLGPKGALERQPPPPRPRPRFGG